MKIQFTSTMLRIRTSEAELATLLDGGRLQLAPALADRPLFEMEVEVSDCAAFSADDRWRVGLARAELEAYAATLPRREALALVIAGAPGSGAALHVEFEVDVRDSIATRGPRRRVAD